MEKRRCNIFIFTLGVIMLLLRPYVIYQVIHQSSVSKDPIKTNYLMQRLVKKKDELQSVTDETAVEVKRFKVSFNLPMLLLNVFIPAFLSLRLLIMRINVKSLRSSVFQISPENHCYLKQLRFQV
ncbi:hypothetical protein [Mucilaginibacter sp. SP1R1]|uniref:hypothetical protein n=1 Tax=Mucilaginibacter sp. SP1R1 TaxID=2723091 RepID=UPI0016141417|nr:hypothetical protein [Mucilaginibacter sp. SP1R1]MBB6148443.1 hypothetical protein [Mucilaginibacter sp. SP1R1]